MGDVPFDDLVAAAKKAAATLRDAGIPFLLAGGLACWARGGPASDHDVDLAVKPADAERALTALSEAGFRTEKPPEEWLFKAYDGDAMVDVIFRPAGVDVDEGMFERADEREVNAVNMAVMSADDIIITKVLSLSEHHLDFDSLLQVSRPLREQVNWEHVRERTKASPFSKAFFALVEELGLVA